MIIVRPKLTKEDAEDLISRVETWFQDNPRRKICVGGDGSQPWFKIRKGHVREGVMEGGIMSRLSEDKWVRRWVVPSSSGDGDYIVAQDKDGNWACSCRGWTSHVPRTDCRHIREVKAGGGATLTEHVIGKLAGR